MTVDHQSDVTEVSNPTRDDLPTEAPKHSGEVFDYLVRKGPMTFKEVADNTPFMSRNDVYSSLTALKETGYVERTEGNLKELGTTRDVWFVPKDD